MARKKTIYDPERGRISTYYKSGGEITEQDIDGISGGMRVTKRAQTSNGLVKDGGLVAVRVASPGKAASYVSGPKGGEHAMGSIRQGKTASQARRQLARLEKAGAAGRFPKLMASARQAVKAISDYAALAASNG